MTQMGETWTIGTDGIDQEEQEFNKTPWPGKLSEQPDWDTLRIRFWNSLWNDSQPNPLMPVIFFYNKENLILLLRL